MGILYFTCKITTLYSVPIDSHDYKYSGLVLQMLVLIAHLYLKIYWSRDKSISSNALYATSKGSDQPAHMHSLIRAFASRLNFI